MQTNCTACFISREQTLFKFTARTLDEITYMTEWMPRTFEGQSVEAVLGSLDLQQEWEDLIVDLHTLWVEDDVDGPRNLGNKLQWEDFIVDLHTLWVEDDIDGPRNLGNKLQWEDFIVDLHTLWVEDDVDGPWNLGNKLQWEDLIVDLHTLWVEDDVDGPRNLGNKLQWEDHTKITSTHFEFNPM